MPKRFSPLRVSIVCKAGTSTRKSECSGLKGMMAVVTVEWRGGEQGAVCGERAGGLVYTRTSGY